MGLCDSCGNVNFMKRSDCKKCGAQRIRGQKRLGMRPGDWICPNCDDLVFSNKTACKSCGFDRPMDAESRKVGMRPGDWICPTCGDLVFAKHDVCKMCQTRKPEGDSPYVRQALLRSVYLVLMSRSDRQIDALL